MKTGIVDANEAVANEQELSRANLAAEGNRFFVHGRDGRLYVRMRVAAVVGPVRRFDPRCIQKGIAEEIGREPESAQAGKRGIHPGVVAEDIGKMVFRNWLAGDVSGED